VSEKSPIDPGWAWAPYRPDAERPWNLRRAAHLYRRAAFGGRWREIEQALGAGPERSVARLLQPEADVAAFQQSYHDYESSAIDPESPSTDVLQEWWLRRILESPHPLLEKMTLFWHNHFAISNERLPNAARLQRHVQSLRSQALGRFEPLLQGVVSGPAVFLTLNADKNTRTRPNANLARAVLEQYCLGPGVCTPADVREAARALSGWIVEGGRLRYVEREHDGGVKTLLGRQGAWGRDDLLRIAVAHPATPAWIVRKLYRYLISETEEPPESLLTPLAESFAKDDDVGRLVGVMLRSNLFFSPVAYRQRVKSPLEFALGIARSLEGLIPTAPLGAALAGLGQNLCRPPTSQGWEGGRLWITAATLIGRDNLAAALLAPSGEYQGRLDPAKTASQHGCHDDAQAAGWFFDLLLGGDLAAEVRHSLLSGRGRSTSVPGGPAQAARQFVHAIVTLPEYQLA
jgi:uncharacterized protein (DUF1800 family)